jgi:Concanavalin A-like lectin/glucanases superfamily
VLGSAGATSVAGREAKAGAEAGGNGGMPVGGTSAGGNSSAGTTSSEPEGNAGGEPGSGGMSAAGAGGRGDTAGSGGVPNSGGGGAGGASGGAGANAGASAGGGASGGSGGAGAAGSSGAGGAPIDNCPSDPAKTAPGICGCGFPDADTATLASCTGLKNALAHRYDFEGTGAVVTDRVGTAHGSVKGTTLSTSGGKGVVVLTGGMTGPYVDLPNHLISSLTSVALEVWVTWGGGNAWQRVFDFGDSTAASPEDNPSTGKSYLFLTPDTGSGGSMRAVFSLNGAAAANETRAIATLVLPQTLTQVVVVADSVGKKLTLYQDGKNVAEQTFNGPLASLNDVNCWLGRSQFDGDPELSGTIHEFRVYKSALTPLQVAGSFAFGPDPSFLAQ